MSDTVKRVLCIGGSHSDERIVLGGPLIDGESTPVTGFRSKGGVAANVARALRASGVAAEIAGFAGADAPEGGSLMTVIPDHPGARYISVEEPDGTVRHGLADTGLYDQMTADWFAGLSAETAAFDAVLTDSNAGPEALRALETDRPLYAIAVSPQKAPHLVPLLPRLTVLFCNRAEADRIGRAALATCPQAVITEGADGGRILRYGDTVTRFAPPPHRPAQQNGLGDRLCGYTIAALLAGRDLRDAVDAAVRRLT